MNNEAFNYAVEITGMGMAGIFLFMLIFYFAIKALDKAFPKKKEEN